MRHGGSFQQGAVDRRFATAAVKLGALHKDAKRNRRMIVRRETKVGQKQLLPGTCAGKRISDAGVMDSAAGHRQSAAGQTCGAPVVGNEGSGHPLGQHGCLSVSLDR